MSPRLESEPSDGDSEQQRRVRDRQHVSGGPPRRPSSAAPAAGRAGHCGPNPVPRGQLASNSGNEDRIF
eukprot:6940308-Pyramimonas_sp.AAC.1